MTQPDDKRGDFAEPSAQDSLRIQLLSDALGDCLPMAHVTAVTSREGLADTVAAQQDLALRTIRSLLDDGLMEIGDIVGASDERIVPWDLPVDAAMARVHDLFVTHYQERALWDFTIWLGLTPTGERLARVLSGQTSD